MPAGHPPASRRRHAVTATKNATVGPGVGRDAGARAERRERREPAAATRRGAIACRRSAERREGDQGVYGANSIAATATTATRGPRTRRVVSRRRRRRASQTIWQTWLPEHHECRPAMERESVEREHRRATQAVRIEEVRQQVLPARCKRTMSAKPPSVDDVGSARRARSVAGARRSDGDRRTG
jgi:hypothetical protein